MKLKDMLRQPPCKKCPYTLGLVHTLRNPCPACRESGYRTYDMFRLRPFPGAHGMDGR